MANFEWVSKAHRFVYHHSRGWIGGWLGQPMVLMYTIGAKSGLTRMVPLQYYPAGDEGIMVLASNNGQPKKAPACVLQPEGPSRTSEDPGRPVKSCQASMPRSCFGAERRRPRFGRRCAS